MIDISEVAKRSGQPASALRYYEERGLIQSTGRHGLRRVFKEDVFDRLALIALGRAAGFSLDEIGEVFNGSKGLDIDRQMLLQKADEIDKSIHRLTMIRDSLRSTAACPASRHVECPNFRQIMESAGLGLLPALGEEEKPIRKRRQKTTPAR